MTVLKDLKVKLARTVPREPQDRRAKTELTDGTETRDKQEQPENKGQQDNLVQTELREQRVSTEVKDKMEPRDLKEIPEIEELLAKTAFPVFLE